jgi:prepilin-type N-terminal cleavage/methylation domain-containing protein
MTSRIKDGKAQRGLLFRLIHQQEGQTLIEVLIALAIFGVVAVAFLTALTTTSVALIVADQKTTAESLARSELEYIRNSPYADTYDDNGDGWLTDTAVWVFKIPTGYSLQILTGPAERAGMQQITVKVYQKGELVLTTVTYK